MTKRREMGLSRLMLGMLLHNIVDMSNVGDKPCKPSSTTHSIQHMPAASVPAPAHYYPRYSVHRYNS
jgi:hypothetical protein